jgi:hypothetical protein
MKKDAVVIKETNGFIQKSVTIRPDKENQIFQYKQIKAYVQEQKKKLPKGTKMIVRASNILRDTTLKGYDDDFMDEDDYDEYVKGKVKNIAKFKHFFNFTVTIIEPKSMFVKF